MLRDIIPVIPVLIVSLSACAVLLAEAFRRRGEWMPVGWLALIGVMGGLVTSAALWNRSAQGAMESAQATTAASYWLRSKTKGPKPASDHAGRNGWAKLDHVTQSSVSSTSASRGQHPTSPQ